jgi:hypothetical protein
MKNFKKIIRLLVVAIIILLASFGVAIGGAILPGHRGKFQNQEVTIELVESKETRENGQEAEDEEKKT